MSFVPSDSTTCDISPPSVWMSLNLFAEANSGTLLNWMMNLRFGALPRVSHRIGSETMFGCQSVQANAIMLLGLALNGMNRGVEKPGVGVGSGPNMRKPFEKTLTLSYVFP